MILNINFASEDENKGTDEEAKSKDYYISQIQLRRFVFTILP